MPMAPPTPAIVRTEGTHAATRIDWVLISLEGKGLAGAAMGAPLLTAQCSRLPNGKLKFELLASDPGSGSAEPVSFQAPWQPAAGQLFPPNLARVSITMEFLGYTHVKPVKRQWEHPEGTYGVLRYATPGRMSNNMEEIAFYLQYLRALPTLRLTLPPGPAEEFETTALLQAIKAEPLCTASGL